MNLETASDRRILKRFLKVGDRLVHYRTAGEGPPVLLLHDSVKSSVALIPLIERLSAHFRVYALDTPGYGNSDPLSGSPSIADFAQSVKETMDALGLDKPCLYGRHTSSKVVLELLCNWPERFAVGVMDGLSFAEPPNSAEFIARYLPPFEIDDHGAYLTRVWTQVYDMTRWFPWFAKSAKARMAVPRRVGLGGHRFALDFLMAGQNYASAYGAALRYEGWPRLAALAADAPAVFMTAEDDVLYPFLDRLPDGWTKERVPPGVEAVLDRVEQIFLRAPNAQQHGDDVVQPEGRYYRDYPHGQLYVQEMGEGDATPTLFLHELPGGASSATPFVAALSQYGRVLAPDLPGGGESDSLGEVAAEQYADLLADLIAARCGGKANVIAMTTSTPLAVALAARHPDKVAALILDGLVAGDADMAEQFCPPVAFDPAGAYVTRLWHQLRDQAVQWPWYEPGVEAIRWVDAQPTGLRLHRRLIDVLKQLDHYGEATRAALRFDALAAIANLGCPLLVLTVDRDPAYAACDRIDAAVTRAPRAENDKRAAQANEFFTQNQ